MLQTGVCKCCVQSVTRVEKDVQVVTHVHTAYVGRDTSHDHVTDVT